MNTQKAITTRTYIKSVHTDVCLISLRDKYIREDWKPENILLRTLSSACGIKINKINFIKDGIANSLSVLIQRFFLKMEKNVENKTYGFVDTLFEKIKSIIYKFVNYEAKRDERKEARN